MSILSEPSDKEFKALLSSSSEQRYKYFFNRVAVTEKLWLLFVKEEVLELKNESKKWVIPVWPYKRYAEVFCLDKCHHLKNLSCEIRQVNIFISKSKKLIDEEYSTIAIFPVKDEKVKELTIEQFEEEFQYEYQQVSENPTSW